MQLVPRRVFPWVGLAALVALVVAAAVIGSLSSTAGEHMSTSSVLQKPKPLVVPAEVLPQCQNGQIPSGAAGCTLLGIHPDAQESGPMGWTFQVTNAYSGVYNGHYVTVFAGAALTPDPTGRTAHGVPDGGGIRVSVDQSPTMRQYVAPETPGLVYIRAVSGGVVTLQRADGTTVTFNLTNDTYR
jgi:hypothetical protein